MAFLASGCLQASIGCSSPGEVQTGIRVGDETLKQFKSGETSVEWITTVIGKPTSRARMPTDPSTEVLRYTTTAESSGLFSFLSGKSMRSTATIYFVITDGKLVRLWADRETERTLLGKEAKKDTGEKQKV